MPSLINDVNIEAKLKEWNRTKERRSRSFKASDRYMTICGDCGVLRIIVFLAYCRFRVFSRGAFANLEPALFDESIFESFSNRYETD